MHDIIANRDVRLPEQFPRISERYRIEGLELHWSPPASSFFGRGKPTEVVAQVFDLSIAGALLLAPANDKIRVGMRIPLRVGTASGVAEIRNIRRSSLEGMAFYGVGFAKMSDALVSTVIAVVEKIRRENDPNRRIRQK